MNDFRSIGRRGMPNPYADPFFTSQYGPTLPRAAIPLPSVTANGQSQSMCGGNCSVSAPRPAYPVAAIEMGVPQRPAITRVIQALGRVMANI